MISFCRTALLLLLQSACARCSRKEVGKGEAALSSDMQELRDLVGTNNSMMSGLQAIEVVETAAMQGEIRAKAITCEQLQGDMVKVIDNMKGELDATCTEGSDPGSQKCDFSSINLEEAIMTQEMITSVVVIADRKECLPMVMGAKVVQQKLKDFLAFVPQVLHASGPEGGRARVQEAYLQLVSFIQGAPSLVQGLADGQSLVVTDGGSWRKYRSARQCQVADWKDSAVQHVLVAAMTSCAATTMLMGVNGELSDADRKAMHLICLKIEQGNVVPKPEREAYEAKLEAMDAVVSSGLKLAVNSILDLGLASGLAAVRAASRGNQLPVLLQGGSVDFSAAFTPHLASAGLAVRPADSAFYADCKMIKRAETVHRLQACVDVKSLQTQSAFAEGAKPLTIQALALKQKVDMVTSQGLLSTGGQISEEGMTLAFTGIAGSIYFVALSYAFFSLLAASPGVGGLIIGAAGLVYSISLVGGIYAIWRLMGAFVSKTHGEEAEKSMDQCMQDSAGKVGISGRKKKN